jgi:hypothetical protein
MAERPLRLAADTNVLVDIEDGVEDVLDDLAETALLDCSILLTSDEHLRAVDHEQATLLLRRYELIAPVIATPREIARKFFR